MPQLLMPPVNASTLSNLPEALTAPQNSTELMLLQDMAGQYLSVHWPFANIHGISVEQLAGQPLHTAPLRPVNPEFYLESLRRVLSTQTGEQFECTFQCLDQVLQFALVMTPLLAPNGVPIGVAVTGQHIDREHPHTADDLLPAASPDRDHRLLAQLSWNIRQTLELPTIWQQTVNGLGTALKACRCVVYSLDRSVHYAKVEAEYRLDGLSPMLGETSEIAQDNYLYQALMRFRPTDLEAPTCPVTPMSPCVVANEIIPATNRNQTRLIIATGYQDKPNGFIVLYQCDRPRLWHPAEVAFLRELADQVGTAIAHATLFNELQKANTNLVRKQEALEDARHQAEEASRLKSEFLANTSHELRTPLNGILGFLKLVIDGMADDAEEQEEFLTEAFRSAQHLLDIINDVLDLAKIEAGKMQIDCSPINLNELLEDIDRQQASSAKQKSLSFEMQQPATLDEVVVHANYQRLKQVLINLVGNAIKFTHEGGVTISTEILRKRVPFRGKEFPGIAMVRVADTGIGVSLDKQDRLFQSFSQIDGSLTRRYGGTGLGLAISQRLIEEMGGEMNFYSMGEGLGSTVTFTIPLFQEPVIAAG
jgi:signal transduction histidine kinase